MVKLLRSYVQIGFGILLFFFLSAFGYRKIVAFKLVDDVTIQYSKFILERDGKVFRDLNKNQSLDVYENPQASIDDRVADLIGKLNLEEKAGLLFITGTGLNAEGSLSADGIEGIAARMPAAKEQMDTKMINHFNIWDIPDNPAILAKWYNNLQRAAEDSRLGIPVSLASDPRHHFSQNIFSLAANGFSQFCETLGLAAIGDEDLVEQFADIVRKEYLAVGIRIALHPQIDLATEPRWPRINGGYGEDAELTSKMVRAYIRGMQGSSLSDQSIACMTKHFPGGGPQKNGLDPHFEFQEGQIYPGDNFEYHLLPFEAAIDEGTASIMPYYGIPTGQTDEEVAMAFNKMIITDLLRNKYDFEGVICTDWGLITDAHMGPVVWPARAWGVEHLSEPERVLKILQAGCDQFGGEARPELVIQLVKGGKLSEERIDESLYRILKQKFELGLFDRPFVDEDAVSNIVGNESSSQLALSSQERSITLLKNEGKLLPIKAQNPKIYIENVDSTLVANYGQVVTNSEDADFAIIRLKTPFYPVETQNPFARGFHHGDLDFKGEEKERILTLLDEVPTIVDLYLDRPAVIPEIAEMSGALVANYGASDQALLNVLFGSASPEGNLPFELPSSMQAVEAQLTDMPYDSEDPLFAYGYGLRYKD